MSTPEPPVGSPIPGPVYSQQPSPAPYAAPVGTLPPTSTAKKPLGIALIALIVGIVAFFLGLIPVLGAIVGIGAIVLGVLALRRQLSKGFAVTAIVLGGMAALSSVGTTAGLGAIVSDASADKPIAVIATTTEPVAEETTTPVITVEPVAPAETVAPAAPAPAVPVETVAPAAPAAPAVPVEFLSALKKAENYSSMMHMSKAGLYDQLVSEYGEQFSAEAAQYAVDNIQADWNANALAKAKSYQDTMAMSPEAIRDQLVSEYGEQFTQEEADYAILNLNS